VKEVALAILDKLTGGYLAALILILVFLAVYVFRHLKWNKNGKPYWYSEQFEQHKLRDRALDAKLDKLLTRQDDHSKRLAGLEGKVSGFIDENEKTQLFILRQTITNEQLPDQERMSAYDEYASRGANGWVGEYWKRELPKMQARMNKRLNGRDGAVKKTPRKRMPGQAVCLTEGRGYESN
jgi:hypothetical protein